MKLKRFTSPPKWAFGTLCLLHLLSACGPANISNTLAPEPTAYASSERADYDSSLDTLLSSSIVSEEEALLRDQLNREVLLDFPIRIGVIFYDFQSKLDPSDREALFDTLSASLTETEHVRETIEIPHSLVTGRPNIEELRKLGARFQTDILILLNAKHTFEASRDQELSFWDSFSAKRYYESKVKYQAIALDVFTGTLLSPFDATENGERILLDLDTHTNKKRYQYQKSVEEKAWGTLQKEALLRLENLKQDVEKRKAQQDKEASQKENQNG